MLFENIVLWEFFESVLLVWFKLKDSICSDLGFINDRIFLSEELFVANLNELWVKYESIVDSEEIVK